jgi:hypothetical protein
MPADPSSLVPPASPTPTAPAATPTWTEIFTKPAAYKSINASVPKPLVVVQPAGQGRTTSLCALL